MVEENSHGITKSCHQHKFSCNVWASFWISLLYFSPSYI